MKKCFLRVGRNDYFLLVTQLILILVIIVSSHNISRPFPNSQAFSVPITKIVFWLLVIYLWVLVICLWILNVCLWILDVCLWILMDSLWILMVSLWILMVSLWILISRANLILSATSNDSQTVFERSGPWLKLISISGPNPYHCFCGRPRFLA